MELKMNMNDIRNTKKNHATTSRIICGVVRTAGYKACLILAAAGLITSAQAQTNSPTDTDGDLFKDSDEVEMGFNPNSAASKPTVAADWVSAVKADAPAYWYRFEATNVTAGVTNSGSVKGFAGKYGTGIVNNNLGKTSAGPSLGKAIEFTGPKATPITKKYVDFGAVIPELTNFRSNPRYGKETTVEYWIKTTQNGNYGNQAWNSPGILANERPGDGDMYWGWFNEEGDFGFSTADFREAFVPGITDGAWHHVVLVKVWNETNDSISKVYIDGGELSGGATVETTTPAGFDSLTDPAAGIRFLGFTEHGLGTNSQYIGFIDEVAIYTNAFNEARARLHFLAASSTNTPPVVNDFAITLISVAPVNGNVLINWNSLVNTNYSVQRTATLPTNWVTLGTIKASTARSQFTDTNRPPNSPRFFYRVQRN